MGCLGIAPPSGAETSASGKEGGLAMLRQATVSRPGKGQKGIVHPVPIQSEFYISSIKMSNKWKMRKQGVSILFVFAEPSV